MSNHLLGIKVLGFIFLDDAMDDAGCQLTVRDVANLLRARHAIITGEKFCEFFSSTVLIILPFT